MPHVRSSCRERFLSFERSPRPPLQAASRKPPLPLLVACYMVDSPPARPLVVPSPSMSPPTTPPTYIPRPPTYIPRPPSQTPTSDDSSVIEMSFEYTADGQRVSRGRHSSPPTPIEDLHPRTSLPKDAASRSGSPDSLIAPHSRRRLSLSRSESMPGVVSASHERQEVQESRPSITSAAAASAARSFQRTVSGPVSLPQSISQTASSSSTSSRTSSISAKLRGQLPGDVRVSMRSSQAQRELRLQTDDIQEEKENMDEAEAHVDWVVEAGLKRRSIPPRSAPADSLEAHHYSSSSSARGSFTSGSSNPPAAAAPAHQRATTSGGRLIASKPARPIRVLRPPAKSAIGKIPEIDVPDEGEGSEAEVGINVDDWPDEASAAVRVLNGVGARERVNALSSSASNRPRRSASLSETNSPDGLRTNGLSYQSSADVYRSASRPGSSLGHASNGHVSAASRVARAAYESKLRRDRDAMLEGTWRPFPLV
ncbi:hypothetical protein OF83DRAFT_131028 [Amylostereum chailletii]|nr:hypothetical protein OF83DRAFT_131028 [Amylostereum chailletii]